MFKYKELINRIEADIFPHLTPGALLPGAEELCQRYEVSEITVKKALSLLAKEKRVRRIPGKGTLFHPEHPSLVSHVRSRPQRTIFKVLTLNGWESADLLEKLCQEFTVLYPDTEFEFHRQSPSCFEPISPEGYDLVHGNTWMIREYLTTPEWQKNFLALQELPGFFINENIYFEEVLKWCRSHGRLTCFPLGISPIFAMFHMDYPVLRKMTLPLVMTAMEFQDLLYRLRYERQEESKYYPFLLEMSENRWPGFVKMMGGKLFDAESRQCTFNRPQTVAALKAMQRLTQDRIVPNLQFGGNFSVSGLFATGKIGCMWGSFKYMRANIRKKNNIQYRMLPQQETGCSHLLIDGLMVQRNCNNLDMAGKLFNFLQTSDAQLKICRQADTFSAQKDLAHLYFENLAGIEPSVINILEQVKYAEPVAAAPRSSEWRTLGELLPKIWMGVDSVENVCQEITEAINISSQSTPK